MFTDPASAEPWDSGVGENDTSMRERLLIEIMSDCTARVVPPAESAVATLKPSTVTGTKAEGTPLSEMSRVATGVVDRDARQEFQELGDVALGDVAEFVG
jgi:hypothetical protein